MSDERDEPEQEPETPASSLTAEEQALATRDRPGFERVTFWDIWQPREDLIEL